MLVNMKTLLAEAEKGNYAVGSFSVANMEMVLGVIKAAEELKAPIILQIAEVRLKQSPLNIIGPLMVAAAKSASVPVAVHFDHGKTMEKISEALEIGFTSVMFDGSHLPLDENIAQTKRVIEKAKQYGAAVEAEIGCVGGSEDGSEDILDGVYPGLSFRVRQTLDRENYLDWHHQYWGDIRLHDLRLLTDADQKEKP